MPSLTPAAETATWRSAATIIPCAGPSAIDRLGLRASAFYLGRPDTGLSRKHMRAFELHPQSSPIRHHTQRSDPFRKKQRWKQCLALLPEGSACVPCHTLSKRPALTPEDRRREVIAIMARALDLQALLAILLKHIPLHGIWSRSRRPRSLPDLIHRECRGRRTITLSAPSPNG